jgi:hypothetical protein
VRDKVLDGPRPDAFMQGMTSQPDQCSAAPSTPGAQGDGSAPAGKPLPPAAQRALAEAQARRDAAAERANSGQSKEVSGRGGLDPVRYGDWEVKGLTSDF